MMGSNLMDEIDCNSFFDHMDDLIEFPADNDCGLSSVDGNDFPAIWSDPADGLPRSDTIFSGGNSNSASALSAELDVPYEDIKHLEWLSTFMEDSFADGGMTLGKDTSFPDKKKPSHHHHHHQQSVFQTSSPVSVLESSSSSSSASGPVGKTAPLGLQRARSKRPRPASFNPRIASQPFFVPNETEYFVTECFAESRPARKVKPASLEPKKKKKVKLSTGPLGPSDDVHQNQPSSQAVRKCLHCEITKTPQWRAGPTGPKTLCNACGVRYKSGRLFPEYRPAASPTFVPSLHSNSHKKVLEMRVKGKTGEEAAPTPPPAKTITATIKPEILPE